MAEEKKHVTTGIEYLDRVLQGGFPSGSLIVLAGNPGTKKTMFALQFLQKAAEHGDNGIYVSFAEGHEALLNLSRMSGLNLDDLKQKISVMDLVTVKQDGTAPFLDSIIHQIQTKKAKRLAVDSYSALSQAFREKIEARIVLHTILGKMVRQMGCTTILVLDGEDVAKEMEAYVADGVITLKRTALEGRLLREIEIIKLRGTKIFQHKMVFTGDKELRVIEPFRQWEPTKREKFRPSMDTREHLSSGSPDLDALLGGGFPRGTTVLIEIDNKVPEGIRNLLVIPIILNACCQRRGIIRFGEPHPQGIEFSSLGYISEEDFNNCYRLVTKVSSEVGSNQDTADPFVKVWTSLDNELKEKTGESPLYV
ncbi:MAG: ATPase domain-containing protein, partial [Candidatus Bathyarchaeia archaeon]